MVSCCSGSNLEDPDRSVVKWDIKQVGQWVSQAGDGSAGQGDWEHAIGSVGESGQEETTSCV